MQCIIRQSLVFFATKNLIKFFVNLFYLSIRLLFSLLGCYLVLCVKKWVELVLVEAFRWIHHIGFVTLVALSVRASCDSSNKPHWIFHFRWYKPFLTIKQTIVSGVGKANQFFPKWKLNFKLFNKRKNAAVDIARKLFRKFDIALEQLTVHKPHDH